MAESDNAFDVDGLLAVCDLLGAAVFAAVPPAWELRFTDPRRTGYLIPPDELERVRAAISEVARIGGRVSLEHRVFRSGDDERWVRTSVTRSRTGQVVGAMEDLTTHRRDEEHWREVQTWLVTLGEALPFDFWICDRSGRYVLQNPASVARIGNALGQRAEERLMCPRLQALWQEAFGRAMAGETSRQELAFEADGAMRNAIRVVSPVRQGDEVQGALAVDLDVTELKATEARLQRSLHELAEAQDALVRRRQLAALGEMAAVMAHEVRNPLGAIANAAALIRRKPNPSENDLAIHGIIEEEVARLDSLVKALLEFVRPNDPVLAPVPLAAVLERALAQTLIDERAEGRIRVRQQIDPQLPPVPMDANLLGLAIVNVLRNAIQAMPAGGELHIELERELFRDRSWARLCIRDSGEGVPQELRERLFHPFVTSRPTGSGLGLAIVKKVIDEHRGEIDLRSAEGRGTICTIRVPL